jgi:hypothetical protein
MGIRFWRALCRVLIKGCPIYQSGPPLLSLKVQWLVAPSFPELLSSQVQIAISFAVLMIRKSFLPDRTRLKLKSRDDPNSRDAHYRADDARKPRRWSIWLGVISGLQRSL